MQSTFINLHNRNACILSCECSHIEEQWVLQRLLLAFLRRTKIFSFPFLFIYSHLRAICLCTDQLSSPPVCISISCLPRLIFLCIGFFAFICDPPAPNPFKWILLLSCALSCFHFVFFFLLRFLFSIQFFLSLLSCSHRLDQFISFTFHILP